MSRTRRHAEVYICSEGNCNKLFTTRTSRDRHRRLIHYGSRRRVQCVHKCGRTYFENSNSLNYHQRTCDNNNTTIGYGSSQQFSERSTSNTEAGGNGIFKLIKTAHERNYKLFRMELHTQADIQSHLREGIMQDVKRILQKEHRNVKFSVAINCKFKKALRPNVITDPPIFFRTMPTCTTQAIQLDEVLNNMYEHLWNQVEQFVRNGSGWIIQSLEHIDMQVFIYIYIIVYK